MSAQHAILKDGSAHLSPLSSVTVARTVKHLISLSLVAAAWLWPSSEVARGFLVRCL